MIFLYLVLTLIGCAGVFVAIVATDDERWLEEELGHKRKALIFRYLNVFLLALGLTLSIVAVILFAFCIGWLLCWLMPDLFVYVGPG